MNLIKAVYVATRPDRDPAELAENIAREQSLELTRRLIPEPIAERWLGQVLAVTRMDEQRRRCLYLPHVAGSGDHLRRQLDAVVELGLGGVVLCTWVMGLETAAIAARERGLMWLSHPAFAGTMTESEDRGIATPVLLGTLVRVAGADISIFPGPGGRIQSSDQRDIRATCRALTEPLGTLAPALPCFGGGKTLDQAPSVTATHGSDIALLVGGDLIGRGAAIEADTRATIKALETATGH